MKRFRRPVALLLIVLLLQGLLVTGKLPPAYAAGFDPLGLLPGWADLLDGQLNPAAPPDPLAGLLPRNPLDGLLPQGAGGSTGGAPGAAGGSAAPESQPPGAVSALTPPPAPVAPVVVSPTTGELTLTATDLDLPGLGPAIALTRRYSSGAAAADGPLGFGWDFSLNNRLHMYVHYHITEHRGDGGKSTFHFADGTGGAFVNSYDGDSLIHTDLAKGSYSPAGLPGWSLVREAQDRYVLTRSDGSRYIYFGYHAPWRSSEDPRAGRLLRVEDRNGNAIDLTYSSSGQLTRVADGDGRFLAFEWSGSRITKVTDQTGRAFAYSYSGGNLTGVSAPDHPTQSYSYDSSHRLTGLGGGPAGSITYAYDSEGRVSRAGLATYAYSATQTTLTDAAGGVWRYELDSQKRIGRTVDPVGGEVVTTFDSEGRTTAVTTPAESRAYTYDDQGRTLTETRNGQLIRYQYGAFGQITRVESPAGVTSLAYDPKGNLVRRTDSGGIETTYSYDSRGRLLTETNGGGQTTTYSYQTAPHGRPTTVTDPAGGVVSRAFDPLGRLLHETDSRGFTASYSYDRAGRLLTATNPGGGVTTYAYDVAGVA